MCADMQICHTYEMDMSDIYTSRTLNDKKSHMVTNVYAFYGAPHLQDLNGLFSFTSTIRKSGEKIHNSTNIYVCNHTWE